jgi:hypothetical protein
VTNPIPAATLDAVLAVQIGVAWAGESRDTTGRLGWWQTDLVDPTGGGDFMARLLPRTHAWASLEAVREAARRADDQGRRAMADPDHIRSLFFLGFDVDERLAERLSEHKRSGATPSSALGLPVPMDAAFDADAFAQALRLDGKPPAFDVVPGGRQLKGTIPEQLDLAVRALAAALVPLPDRYPLPFYRVKP